MVNTPPDSLVNFQRSFAAYARSAESERVPIELPTKQSQVYAELLFNNVCSFIDRCFPVAKTLFPQVEWRECCRSFYKNWPSYTPYFNEIPYEFVKFIASQQSYKTTYPWLSQLLHYEWLELQVQTDPAQPLTEVSVAQPTTQLSHIKIHCNPTLQIAQYDWPVHRIYAGHIPAAQLTFLLVFRDGQDQVKFVEANAITAALISFLQQNPTTLTTAIESLTSQIPNLDTTNLQAHAHPIIEDFIQQELLWLEFNE